MASESISKAAEVSGSLRYWSLQEIKEVVAVASAGLPSAAPGGTVKYAALSRAYWDRVHNIGPGCLTFFVKKDTSTPETREGIAAKARAQGVDAVWAILEPVFRGRQAVPYEVTSEGYGDFLIELGPIAVGLATSAFKHEGFSSQQSFHLLGMTFLTRAKLLTALVVSLAGDDELQGERIALASASAHSAWEESVRELLGSVAGLPAYDVPVRAALAKLDEYAAKGDENTFRGIAFHPKESNKDVISSQYQVPGGVDYF